MSFIERVATCNQYDLTQFLPLHLSERRIGHVRKSFTKYLTRWPEIFVVGETDVTMSAEFTSHDCARRTEQLAQVTAQLSADGLIHGWRDELHRVGESVHTPPHFLLERAAIPHFGVGGYSVHINGLVHASAGPQMWVAKRAANKPTYPGLLDQIVAGGLPADQSLMGNVIKECHEEAGIDEALASTAKPCGYITYTMETAAGLRPDTVHVYDLELPPSFTPQATDGEVESFELWDMNRVTECVRDTERFKSNCALVIIDYLIRQRCLRASVEELTTIKRALRPHEAS